MLKLYQKTEAKNNQFESVKIELSCRKIKVKRDSFLVQEIIKIQT